MDPVRPRDGADATLAKAAKLGSKVIVPWNDTPERLADGLFIDPQGVPLGLLQPPKA